MTEHRFQDHLEIANTRILDSGDLLVEAAVARTGVQDYLASEIGLIGDHIVPVHRPQSAVFDKTSLATYAGKPVTIGHPRESVTADNWKHHAVGEIQDEVARDGDKIRVTFRVRDGAAIRAIRDGKRELSMGYSTPVKIGDGVTSDGQKYGAEQTGPIEINHLAVVDVARGGKDLRIGDGAKQWGAAPITQRANDEEAGMPDTLKKVMVDGLTVETTDAGAQAITKLLADMKAMEQLQDEEIKQVTDKLEAAQKDVETKDGEIKALEKKLADATSPKALADMAKGRAKTMAAGKKAGMSEEDMEEMDDAAIRRAVVAKDLGDAVAKDLSDDAIEGAFLRCVKDAKFGDEALGGGIKTQDSDPWAFMDAEKKKGA
ncbi:MAG: DUF2213 domain-containing protein [Pseudomonadota bacterium]